jgi:hypothetical protein
MQTSGEDRLHVFVLRDQTEYVPGRGWSWRPETRCVWKTSPSESISQTRWRDFE